MFRLHALQVGDRRAASGKAPLVLPPSSMEELFDKAALQAASSSETHQITQLVRLILQYDPSERPTMAGILQYVWFVRDDW
ncbi:hypothetical protein SEUCBS140593_010686, partial [Sporothrix eucalyptigena]